MMKHMKYFSITWALAVCIAGCPKGTEQPPIADSQVVRFDLGRTDNRVPDLRVGDLGGGDLRMDGAASDATTDAPVPSWTAMPGVGLTSDSPTTVRDNQGRIWLFVRGIGTPEGDTWYNVYEANNWGGWTKVPGERTTPSAMGATIDAAGAIRLFMRSGTNEVWENRYIQGEWKGWNLIAGSTTNDAPGAVLDGTSIRLFIRNDQDNEVYENVQTSNVWSGWKNIYAGTRMLSGPAALRGKGGQIRVYARDLNNDIAESKLINGAWSKWASISVGKTLGRPSVLLTPTGNTYLLVRSLLDQVWLATMSGINWTGWQLVDGAFTTLSGPALVIDNGVVRAFARGQDDKIYTTLIP